MRKKYALVAVVAGICWFGSIVGALYYARSGNSQVVMNLLVRSSAEVDKAYAEGETPVQVWALNQWIKLAQAGSYAAGDDFRKIHPLLFIAYGRLAKIAFEEGNQPEARRYAEHALEWADPQLRNRIKQWPDVINWVEQIDSRSPK